MKVELIGTDVGGGTATNAILNGLRHPSWIQPMSKIQPMQVRPKVICTDLIAARADALAARYTQHGYVARGREGDGRTVSVSNETTILFACTDDAAVQERLIRESEAELTVAGLLIVGESIGAYGNTVLGFGASVPIRDLKARQEGVALFQALNRMTPDKRTPSRLVTEPLLSKPQVREVRQSLYRHIGSSALAYVQKAGVPTGLSATVLDTRKRCLRVVSLQLREREGRTRKVMNLESSSSEQAVLWVDGEKPWAFFTYQGRGLELPSSPGLHYAEATPTPVQTLLQRREALTQQQTTETKSTGQVALGVAGAIGVATLGVAAIGAGLTYVAVAGVATLFATD